MKPTKCIIVNMVIDSEEQTPVVVHSKSEVDQILFSNALKNWNTLTENMVLPTSRKEVINTFFTDLYNNSYSIKNAVLFNEEKLAELQNKSATLKDKLLGRQTRKVKEKVKTVVAK